MKKKKRENEQIPQTLLHTNISLKTDESNVLLRVRETENNQQIKIKQKLKRTELNEVRKQNLLGERFVLRSNYTIVTNRLTRMM